MGCAAKKGVLRGRDGVVYVRGILNLVFIYFWDALFLNRYGLKFSLCYNFGQLGEVTLLRMLYPLGGRMRGHKLIRRLPLSLVGVSGLQEMR